MVYGVLICNQKYHPNQIYCLAKRPHNEQQFHNTKSSTCQHWEVTLISGWICFYFYVVCFLSIAEAAESVHQARPVWLHRQWTTWGPIGDATPSHHRTATLPTQHPGSAPELTPTQTEKKTHPNTGWSTCTLALWAAELTCTHRYTGAFCIYCPTTRWEQWCRGERSVVVLDPPWSPTELNPKHKQSHSPPSFVTSLMDEDFKCPSSTFLSISNTISEHCDVSRKWCICMVLIYRGGGAYLSNSAGTNKRCRFVSFLNSE